MIKWFLNWLKWFDGQLEGKPTPKYLSGKGTTKDDKTD
jgi:hypothetical protein